jgi:protein tyrosine/serine phosphatase
MTFVTRAALTALIAGVVLVAPAVFYRDVYTHGKRLRVVAPGRLYRSGQMTAEGFTEAVARLHVRTVVNVQDDVPDPDIDLHYWTTRTVPESELCRRLGVRYVNIKPDLLSRSSVPPGHPAAVDEWLGLLDDEANYPVLIHCRAGLHRTGVLVAVYRMEYEGWSPAEAFRELKANGFGPWACSSSNEYVRQYVLAYRRRGDRPTR